MALSDFFETTGGGTSSWADEMEALPTAPARREDSGPRRGEPGYLDSMPDRGARTFPGAPQGREELPLPDVPPFTAFVGNLTFETEDEELREFFADLNPVSVRLVKDPQTGKSKGFGYCEFPSRDNLKAALDRTGVSLAGRSVRVNVAEAPASRRDFPSSAADEASQWRRATPIVARDAPAPRRQFSGAGAPGAGDEDRDWSSARGAKFTPAPPARESGFGGRSREHSHEPTAADEAGQWRSSRPFVEAPPSRREAPPHRPAGLADTESTWSRGTRAPVTPAAAPEPAGRQRLALLPRSQQASATPSPESTPAPAKASPFGAARPIDTATREAEAAAHAEERRKKEHEAAGKRKEEAKKAAEKREAEQKEAKERRPVRVHPSRLPPKEAAAAPADAAPAAAPAAASGPDADGFETVTTSRSRKEQSDAPRAAAAPAKKAAAGFSFAAAAGTIAVDDVADKLAETQV